MLKQSLSSEFIVAGDAPRQTFNVFTRDKLKTIQKTIYRNGKNNPPDVCNVIALGDEITKDLVQNGAFSKLSVIFNGFEQTPPFDTINVALYYELKYQGVYDYVYYPIDYDGNPLVLATADGENSFTPPIPNSGKGLDFLAERYEWLFYDDIRNVKFLMWYGAPDIQNAVKITTPPALTIMWLEIRQEA